VTLSPNPLLYTPSDALTSRNMRYGPYLPNLLNVYRNATSTSGGNPVILYMHGGGWQINDKTEEIEYQASLAKLLLAYLLDTGSYGTGATPWSVVSVKYRKHSYGLTGTHAPASSYEETIKSGTGVLGRQSYLAAAEDLQRAVQWCKDNATRFGFNPNKVVVWGSSAGATNAMLAALMPSRRFTIPTQYKPWEALSNSKPLGVLNWFGPINFNPWYLYYSIAETYLGLVESVSANAKADIERAMLVPDSAGNRTSTADVTPLCRAVSPVWHVNAGLAENTGIRIRSTYTADASTNPATIPEYSGSPPYNAIGHDYHQFADLATSCAAVGIDHSGSVIAANNQASWEAELPGTKAWMDAMVDF